MSLTSQLHGGRLEQWCKESFPNTQEVVGHMIAAARQADPRSVPAGRSSQRTGPTSAARSANASPTWSTPLRPTPRYSG